MIPKEEIHLATELEVQTEVVERAATFREDVVTSLKLAAKVQLAKLNLRNAFLEITTFLSASAVVYTDRLTTEELLEKYKDTQEKIIT